jgi:hypothetical protein
MKFVAWTDDHPERENLVAPNIVRAAEQYSESRVDDIDGEPIHVETEEGVVRRFVVHDGQATEVTDAP